jgi:hypothetical protein
MVSRYFGIQGTAQMPCGQICEKLFICGRAGKGKKNQPGILEGWSYQIPVSDYSMQTSLLQAFGS